MSIDTFAIDFGKAQELQTKLENQLAEVNQFKQSNPGSSTARFEYTMRSTYQTLNTSVINLQRLSNEYITQPARFPTVRDKQQRS